MLMILSRKLRQKDTSKYHIQLSLAILLMLIVAFVVVAFSSEKVEALYGGCVTMSVLVHYFSLVAVLWMGAEALLMFQKLVIVFSRITTKLIVSVSIVCWSKYIASTILTISQNYTGVYYLWLQLCPLSLLSFLSLWTWLLVMILQVTLLYDGLTQPRMSPCKSFLYSLRVIHINCYLATHTVVSCLILEPSGEPFLLRSLQSWSSISLSSFGWLLCWFDIQGVRPLERMKMSARKQSYVWWSASVEWCHSLDWPGCSPYSLSM